MILQLIVRSLCFLPALVRLLVLSIYSSLCRHIGGGCGCRRERETVSNGGRHACEIKSLAEDDIDVRGFDGLKDYGATCQQARKSAETQTKTRDSNGENRRVNGRKGKEGRTK
ncbi:hypothetical protein C8R45DRAFT_946766 [Mycena sanguinolenta]|nr:hypothetical protein C8R45DRAFT_946766 [Mycena sanguinolenta]